MSEQALNVIYDTDYTAVVKDWGFVDHQFSVTTEQKPWFLGSIFWNKSTWNAQPVAQPTQTQQDATAPQPTQQKAPGFFDLLFWPLSSNKWWQATAQQPAAEQTAQQAPQQPANTTNNAQVDANTITQNHEIAQEPNTWKDSQKPEKKKKFLHLKLKK